MIARLSQLWRAARGISIKGPDGDVTQYDTKGQEFFVEISAVPVLDETGEVNYVIEVCRDVMGRMQLERALCLTQFSVDRAGDAMFWLAQVRQLLT